jgi:hypothetical protein
MLYPLAIINYEHININVPLFLPIELLFCGVIIRMKYGIHGGLDLTGARAFV